jgi:hypothetical protein
MNPKLLIAKAKEHVAAERRKDDEAREAKERKAEEERLAKWEPHVQAIVTALPAEAKDAVVIPRGEYSCYGNYEDRFAPCEIKIGRVSVFAWHYEYRGEEIIHFSPGCVQLDEEDEKPYWTVYHWFLSNAGSQPDFLLALGKAAEAYERDWKALEKQAARRSMRFSQATTLARATRWLTFSAGRLINSWRS